MATTCMSPIISLVEVLGSSFHSQDKMAKDQAVKQRAQPRRLIPLAYTKVKKQTTASFVQSKEAINYSLDISISQRGTMLHNGKNCQEEKQGFLCGFVWVFSK